VGVVERLSLEAANGHALIAVEHKHRYELAAELCRDLRVADVGCGSGYGARILRESCPSVTGIDNDVATVDMANATVGSEADIRFEVADAHEFLERDLRESFDALVLFETLEHLEDPGRALRSLEAHARDGVRMVVSVPNSKGLHEENPYHLTDFGYEEVLAAFDSFDETMILYQFLAEGSLIRAPEPGELVGRIVATERGELEYANHFIVCVNSGSSLADLPAWARMHLEAAPVHNRHMLNLERANEELRRVNARLARGLIGTADSAAASLLAKVERTERELAAVRQQLAERERAERQEQELHAWIDQLHEEIDRRGREVEAMQATRVWRLAGKYWRLRDRVVRRGNSG
jgi:2-polyprenyl-3-methyl-5-hydroxy-6-metoxy-1,4-benzoquinol methylase